MAAEMTRNTSRDMLADSIHPLFGQFEPLRSGRRYGVPLAAKKKEIEVICS